VELHYKTTANMSDNLSKFEEFKRFIKHFLVYGFANILSRAVGFVLIPIYTRYLTPVDYGVIEILSLISTIFINLLGIGLSSATLRFYFEYVTEDERKEVISSALILCCLFGIIGISLLYLNAVTLSSLFFDKINDQFIYFIRLMLMTMFFDLISEVPLALMRAREKSALFSIVSFTKFVFAISLNIYTVVYLKMGVEGVLISALFSGLIISLFLNFNTFLYCKISFNLHKAIEQLKYGFPLLIVAFGMFVLNSSDRFFLQRITNMKTVGIYALAYKIGMILRFLIIIPFMQNFGPYRFSIMNQDNAKELYAKALTYFVLLLCFFGVGISVFSGELLVILATNQYYSARMIIPMIILSYVFFGIYFIVQIGLYLKKNTKMVSYAIIISAVINVTLNYFCIKKYGIYGAAMATIISFAILSFITNWFSQQIYHIEYEVKRIITIFFVSLMIFSMSLLVHFESFILQVVVKVGLVACFPFLLFLLNFLLPEEKQKICSLFNGLTKNI